MKRHIFFGILILLIVGIGAWEYQMDFAVIEQTIAAHPFFGAIVYIAILATSVVFLPLSSLPLLPLATRIFGVWMTGTLSAIGWWIGCLIAFEIARFARPFLEKIASLEAIDKIERKIPKDIGFVGIVILRMVLPVDIVSFALGLLKHLTFSMYAVASLIGIIPFAFVWSFAGGEVGQGRFLIGATILFLMTFIVSLIRTVWKRNIR